MVYYEQVTCPKCDSKQLTKAGKSITGVQRYICQNQECTTKSFMTKYRYKAYESGVKERVVEMAINGSGIRDTARVLHINKNTVIATLKKTKEHHPH